MGDSIPSHYSAGYPTLFSRQYIEEETRTAWDDGQGIIFYCDGNFWAESNIIPGDLKNQNKKWKII